MVKALFFPFVLVTLTVAAVEPAMDPIDSESLLRYVITQGGLAVVVLVVFWSYRRDVVSLLKRKDNEIAILTELVANAVEAMTSLRDTNQQVVRAVEHLSQRR